MLYYPFCNYDAFRTQFGLRETEGGKKDRRNKILLAFIKQRELLHDAVMGNARAKALIALPTVGCLYQVVARDLYSKSISRARSSKRWSMCGLAFFSDQYEPDDYNGLCEDGDMRSIRYVNTDNGKTYKKKAGKFMRKIMTEFAMGESYPEQVIVWFCEEFAGQWQAYASQNSVNVELHVNDDFKTIYSYDRLVGDFGSCMNGRELWPFYRDSVDAKAAYLTNKDGDIVARCVVFTEVKDENTGEVVRLAERQYSSDGDDLLKRILVDKLIAAGEIDGYKRVGAGCHAADAFVGNNGADWSGRKFSIECRLDYGDLLSYQDSFKWYDIEENRAYNYAPYSDMICLDTTDGEIAHPGEWDSYHEEYVDHVVTVYVDGCTETCDEDRLDDFVYVEHGYGRDEYHHYEDCTWCDDIDEYVLSEDAHYSELLDSDYYDEDEMVEDERVWKEEHGWTWSEWDEEYYEDASEVVTMHFADGDVQTISVDSAEHNFEFEVRDGEYWEIKKEEE